MKEIINKTFCLNTSETINRANEREFNAIYGAIASEATCIAYTNAGRPVADRYGLTESGRVVHGYSIFGQIASSESHARAYKGTVRNLMRMAPDIVERVLDYRFVNNSLFCYYTRRGRLELTTRDRGKYGRWLGDLLIEWAFEPLVGTAFRPLIKGLSVREVIATAPYIARIARFEQNPKRERRQQMMDDFADVSRPFQIWYYVEDEYLQYRRHAADESRTPLVSSKWYFSTMPETPDAYAWLRKVWIEPIKVFPISALHLSKEEFKASVEAYGLAFTLEYYSFTKGFEEHRKLLRPFVEYMLS